MDKSAGVASAPTPLQKLLALGPAGGAFLHANILKRMCNFQAPLSRD